MDTGYTRRQLLGRYIKEQRSKGGAFAFFLLVFWIIFLLYDLEKEAFLYASGLCLCIAAIFFITGFFHYVRMYREWSRLSRDESLVWEELPAPVTLAEEEHQALLHTLEEEYRSHLTRWQKEKQEGLDYYTTWVHQIKTPIAVMRMILEREDTEENRELKAELFRIEQYVEMVLSYIRLGSDQTDFVIQTYDLDSIIRQVIRKYAPQLVRNRICLVYEPVSCQVLTDEKWLSFILEQLLSNAVKYAPQGTITITLQENEVLSISDTGIGIAPEDLPRIFEKGFTGFNGRANQKATGLGLYLCKQTADKLGIGIRATSQPGKGSTFMLELHREPFQVE
jgi:signal transduction histidine kinase